MDTTEERLTRIETKLDMFISTQRDHESRIRVLEKWMWRVSGATVILSTIASTIISFASKFI